MKSLTVLTRGRSQEYMRYKLPSERKNRFVVYARARAVIYRNTVTSKLLIAKYRYASCQKCRAMLLKNLHDVDLLSILNFNINFKTDFTRETF